MTHETHCPKCKLCLVDVGWCRQCGEISKIDPQNSFALDNPETPMSNMRKAAVDFMSFNIYKNKGDL